MNKEIRDQWVAALRSGEYKQGQGALRRPDDTYCCLGVLCDLHAKATGKTKEWVLPLADGWFTYLGRPSYPPCEVCEWAGFTPSGDPILGEKRCSNMNDEGKTFAEIADLIEKHL